MSPECSHLSPHLIRILSGTCCGDRCLSKPQKTRSYNAWLLLEIEPNPERLQQAGNDGKKNNKMKSNIDSSTFLQLGSRHQLCVCRVGQLKMVTVVTVANTY